MESEEIKQLKYDVIWLKRLSLVLFFTILANYTEVPILLSVINKSEILHDKLYHVSTILLFIALFSTVIIFAILRHPINKKPNKSNFLEPISILAVVLIIVAIVTIWFS